MVRAGPPRRRHFAQAQLYVTRPDGPKAKDILFPQRRMYRTARGSRRGAKARRASSKSAPFGMTV